MNLGSKGIAIGVAMAPRVIREGVVKTHLVLNANYALSILEKPGEESDYFFQSLHLIAHECAHVEVTAAFDECFPGFLLQKAHSNILDNMRWQVILAAWDEYAVCRIAGSIGYDPAGGYLETLVKVLSDTRVQCYEIIKAYRIHGDVGQVATEVYGKLGDLLKYSSYFLGAIAAQDAPEERPAALVEGSEFDWFSPFYDRLIEAHGVLWGAFGKWERLDAFEAVGDILQDMADSVGVEATRQPDDLINFDIPLRRESMPDSLGSSFKCNTHRPQGIGCCDGQTGQAPQQRGTWRDLRRAWAGEQPARDRRAHWPSGEHDRAGTRPGPSGRRQLLPAGRAAGA